MAANLIVNRTTTFFNDQDEVGVFDPGDVLYTRVTITNNGDANATNVTFEDSFAGTTLVAGTLNISPIASNDSFTAVANTVLRVGTANTIGGGESTFVAGNLLTNDRGSGTVGTGTITGDSIPGFQIDPFSGATSKGGTYNIYSDGTFNYVNDGNDTEAELSAGDFFTYTIRDAGLDNTYNTADDLLSTATVTITFSTQSGTPGTAVNRVWYVDGSKNTDGTGTSANPFQSSQITSKLSSGGDVDAAGHYIYVENTATGSIALEASQQLIGTGEGLAVGGFAITTDGGGNSALNATSGFAVTLSTNNTVAGINFGGTGGITGTSFGTLTVTDDVVLNTSGTALSLTTGTFAGTGFASTTSTGGTNNVALTGVTGALNLGSGALSGASGAAFTVDGGNGDINFGGTITDDQGQLVRIVNRTGGTIDFNGLISDGFDGDGGTGLTEGSIHLGTNTAGTVRFDGGIHLSTGANDAFTASGNIGSTLIITDPAATMNRITTTTGTALDVQNTTIGNGALVFESINSTGVTANVGINLSNTGAGGLTITGTGAADSGGTIGNKAGVGISLANTGPVSLTDFNVSASADDGIRGTGVNGFTLTRVDIANNGNAVGERGVDMTNLSGTVTIASSNFTGSGEDGLYIRTNQTMAMTVTASTFTTNNDAFGNDGIIIIGYGNAAIVASVTGSTFTDNRGDHFQYSTETAAGTVPTADITFSGNTLSNPQGSATIGGGPTVGGGITINPGGSSNTNVNIANNNIQNSVLTAITLRINTDSTASALFEATVQGNTIGTNGVSKSGSHQAFGIQVSASGSGTITANVAGNTVRESADYAMQVEGIDGNGVINLTATGNTLVPNQTDPNFAREAIRFNLGAASVNVFGQADAHTLRLDLGGAGALANTLDGGPNGFAGAHDYLIRQRFNTRVELEGFNNGGNAFNAAAVISYINGRNTLVTGTGHADANNSVTTTNDGYHNTAAVPMPSLPATPILAEAPPQADEPVDGGLVDTRQVDNGEGGLTNDQYGDPVPADDDGGDSGPVVVDDGVLSQAELDLVVEAAIARWIAAGATPEQAAAMRAAEIKVADLAGLKLAESTGGTITVDGDAAGWRWFVDSTPGSDEEYAGSGTVLNATDANGHAGTRIDLLTVIMHELGHQIGLEDIYAPGETDELMYGTIRAGQRRLPGDDDSDAATGSAVAGSFAFAPMSLGTLEPGRVVTVEWRHSVDAPASGGLVGAWSGQSIVTYSGGTISPDTALSSAEGGNIDSLTLGNLVYTDVNKDGDYDLGTDTPMAGVLLKLFVDQGDGVFGAGDLAVTFEDINGNGTYEQGTDHPAAAGSTGTGPNSGTYTALTATTNGSGVYSFGSLAPGNYIVVVDASNFGAGVLGSRRAHPGAVDPDDADTDNNLGNVQPADVNIDGDNNAQQFLIGQPGTYAATRAITLAYGTEPTAGPNGPALDTNNTLDMGFDLPNQPPALGALSGDSVAFVEDGSPVVIDQSGNATVNDADSPDGNFDDGSLTVQITANRVDAEDILSIKDGGNITVDFVNGKINYSGVEMATFSGGTGGAALVIEFNATALQARVQELLRLVTYDNSNVEDPSTAARTITWTLVDGDGQANGGVDTASVASTVTITAVNDAPVVTDDGTETLAAANEDGVSADPLAHKTIAQIFGVQYSDPDNDLMAGVAVVGNDASGTSGQWQYWNGTSWANIGAATEDAAVALSAPTPIRFLPNAEYSGAAPTLTVRLVDNSGGALTNGATVDADPNGGSTRYSGDVITLDQNIVAVNDVPTSTGLQGDTSTFTEGGAATQIDLGFDATLADDNANFDGGSLTVRVVNKVATEDQLFFSTGSGSGITVGAGNSVAVDGVVIGTYSNGGVGVDRVFTFNSDATPARVERLLKNMYYSNTNNGDPSTAQRTVEFKLVDGAAGSDPQTMTVNAFVNVVPVNDAPESTPPTSSAIGWTEDTASVPLMQGVVLSDIDLPANFAGGSLTINVSGGQGGINLRTGTSFVINEGPPGTFNLARQEGPTQIGIGQITGIGTQTVTISGLQAGATLARLNDLVDDFTFFIFGDNPTAGDRTVTMTFNDGGNVGGGALTTVETQTLTVTAVNDAPFVDPNGAAAGENNNAAYTEAGAAAVLASGLLLTDPDDTNMEAATVSIGAGFITGADSLTLGGLTSGNTGTGGAIAFDYNSTTGVMTLTGTATVADYQAALRQVSFSSTSTTPGASREIVWQANDGTAGGNQPTTTVNITQINAAPTFALDDTGPSATLNYTENDPASVIAPDAQLSDSDSANFDTGTLTVKFDANGEATDQLGIQNQGIGAGQIGVSGADVKYENVTIGTFTGGANGTDLVVTFNGSATPEAAQALVRAITYSSSSQAPSTLSRTVNFAVTDGDGGSSQANAAVNVTATNDAPVNTVPGPQNGGEDQNVAISGISVDDPDSGSGDITVTLSVNNGRLTLATITGLSFSNGDGTGDPTMTFSGTVAEVNAALATVTYRGNLNHEGADTLTIETSDNGLTGTGGAATDTDQVAITLADDGIIHGDSGNNVLNGTPQRDVFHVQQGGNDTINALAGNDTIFFGAAFTAADTVNGGDGTDSIILQGNYSAGVTFGTGSTSNITGVDSISLVPGSNTNFGDTSNQFYDYNLTMLDGNVAAGGLLKVNGFYLRAGEDLTFNGSAELDGRFIILAGLGVDNLTGGSGNDVFVFGHDGRFGASDVVNGGPGYDVVYLRGDYALDFTAPGAGTIVGIESIFLASTADLQYSSGGDGEFDYSFVWDDAMLATNAFVTVNGSTLGANETMSFDGSDEVGGRFRLFGGAAADSLTGGGGHDFIFGGAGGDTIKGNGGADRLLYYKVADSAPGAGNFDTVLDFTHNLDLFDLSVIDANSSIDGDQAFEFIGSAAFSGAGQLRVELIDAVTNRWKVEADVDGGGADFYLEVIVQTLQPLTASDFYL